jgi:hypothetical protein
MDMHPERNARDVARSPDIDGELIYVAPHELHAYWDYARPRLGIVARRSGARWIPEDIYASLKTGGATLHIGVLGEEYVGFIVLQRTVDFDGVALTVWALFSEETVDVIALFHDEIVGFARQIGAKRITFTSPRMWGRRLMKYGYLAKAAVFEREV